MPTRKQRRRRLKGRRHEYEYVYVDDEGREVETPEVETPRRASDANGRKPAPVTRGGRTIQPPSWRRVGKRALFFAPVMFLVITLLENDLSILGRVLITLQMLLLFIPFSYLMDTMTYRLSRRRLEQGQPGASARRR